MSTISWQEAIRYLVLDKVRVLEWYDDWVVRSAHWETRVPAVVMLTEYQKTKSVVRMSKRNVFLRDEYVCQYCGTHCTEDNATLDHILPISKGGKSSWLNLATACKPCNYSKADSTKMKPKRTPYKPEFWELANKRKKRGYHHQHHSWSNYLG